MARRASLRASDSDREHVAERLRSAAAEGRLLTEELEERLTRAFRARTYGELDALIADLPRDAPARRRPASSRSLQRLGLAPAAALVLFAPLVLAIVVAVVTVVFAMLTAWTVLALVLWAMIGHRRRWYGPRWSYTRRQWLPPYAARMYGPRRAHSRSGLRF